MQQMALSAEDLTRLTENLLNLISRFKIDADKSEVGYAVRQNGKLVHNK
jgi:hypothetical protein